MTRAALEAERDLAAHREIEKRGKTMNKEMIRKCYTDKILSILTQMSTLRNGHAPDDAERERLAELARWAIGRVETMRQPGREDES